MPAMLWGLGILSFAAAFLALRVLLGRFSALALDAPNARSLHERPVPRTGGIAVLLGSAVSLGFGAAQLWLPLAVATALGALSFLDDLRGMPTTVRLSAHLIASLLVVWYLVSPMPALQQALLVVSVAWITNLYNFMDGSDGLAAGMTSIGFGAYAAAAHLSGHAGLAALCLALCASGAAFLLHNFHPARIFLGDVGSIPLGFLAATLGILGWQDGVWPLWFPVLVFGPFIGDATITLFKRLARGRRVWEAHREHYYQRLVRMGLGHRRTALIAYAAMLACAAAALLGRLQAPPLQAAIFAATAILLALVAAWVDLRWARFARETGTIA
jgi:UDP-N-acetylmuramyl pentapeptide phosphotransferase/UDP-N-acetylglucosamine-1-phosphate transferase